MNKAQLIKYWISNKIITNKKVISAFRKVKREDFVLLQFCELAYEDEPLPTMAGQTISQPTTVAIMTQALEPRAGQKILEVGAGSGYQAAILAEIVGPKGKVITVELVKELFEFAKKNLVKYKNAKVVFGDALEEIKRLKTKFDRIIVTAAAEKVPEILFERLKENGIILIPIGKRFEQRLLKIKKANGKKEIKDLGPFVFVLLISGRVL